MIYRLATDQVVITKDYQTVPVPKDLDDTICETEPYENKSQVDDVDTIHLIVHDNWSNNYNNNNHKSINDEDLYIQETNEVLQSSLLTSLQSKFLQSSLLVFLLVSLQYEFLQLSLLAFLQHGFLQ